MLGLFGSPDSGPAEWNDKSPLKQNLDDYEDNYPDFYYQIVSDGDCCKEDNDSMEWIPCDDDSSGPLANILLTISRLMIVPPLCMTVY